MRQLLFMAAQNAPLIASQQTDSAASRDIFKQDPLQQPSTSGQSHGPSSCMGPNNDDVRGPLKKKWMAAHTRDTLAEQCMEEARKEREEMMSAILQGVSIVMCHIAN